MATVDLFVGYGWGVEKMTLDDTATSSQPQVVSAAAMDQDTVRVTFDQNMMDVDDLRSYLNPRNYHIETQIGAVELPVLFVEWHSNTQVDLTVSDMDAVMYDVTVINSINLYEQEIDPANDTASFAGFASTFPEPSKLYSAFGLESGIQIVDHADFVPDPDPPYLVNRDPFPGETGVAQNKIIEFDLLDDLTGVNLDSVFVYVEGALAYTGSTDTFSAPYNGPGSSRTSITDGHHFNIDKTSDYASYDTISVRVVAEDNEVPPNLLDTSYSFQVGDYEAPVIVDNFPTGTGVNETTNVSFRVKDEAGAGAVQATLDVTIGAVNAVVDGVVQPAFAGPGTSITPNGFNGFDVVLDPVSNFASTQVVPVTVYVEDGDSNPGTANWSFTIRDYEGCLVDPIDPDEGAIDIDIGTNITIYISDDTDVVEDTIIVEVNTGSGWEYAFVYTDVPQFKPGWDGPGSQIQNVAGTWQITIDPTTDFQVATKVYVRVTAADPDGNPPRLP